VALAISLHLTKHVQAFRAIVLRYAIAEREATNIVDYIVRVF
jgi:hypothetical protein